jgi:hypothetical protein
MEKYLIHFHDTPPGEPGSGGPDNNLYFEHEYTGTYEGAETEAKHLSRNKYMGDFHWWITPAQMQTMPKDSLDNIVEVKLKGIALRTEGAGYKSYVKQKDGSIRCNEYINSADGFPFESELIFPE